MKIYAQNKLDAANGWLTRGLVAYVPDVGLRRNVAQLTLVGGSHDQSMLHESPVFLADGPTMWAGAWWRAPVGYSLRPTRGYEGFEWKLMLFSVADSAGKGRLMVNAEGTDGHLRAYVEGYDEIRPGVPNPNRLLLDTASPLPLDGGWHLVEVQIDRESTNMGRVRLWLDGKLVGDARGMTGYSPFVLAQVGAYSNGGTDKDEAFFLRDVVIADERILGAVVVPGDPTLPSKPPVVTEAEQIALALEGFTKQFAELARRVRALSVAR